VPKRKLETETHKDLEVLCLPDFASWLKWLAKHHSQEEGIWIKFAKKGSGLKSITYVEAREGGIMYGWIDGLKNGLDESFYLTKFTPRRKRSLWSKINRGIANDLIERNQMKPSGMAEVNAAKKDGRWDAAYDSQSMMTIPSELEKLLQNNKQAKEFFESISKANRYAFLFRIHNSKRPETKQRHIEKTMEMLSSGKVYHPKIRKKK